MYIHTEQPLTVKYGMAKGYKNVEMKLKNIRARGAGTPTRAECCATVSYICAYVHTYMYIHTEQPLTALNAHQVEANRERIECGWIMFTLFFEIRGQCASDIHANGYATTSCDKMAYVSTRCARRSFVV